MEPHRTRAQRKQYTLDFRDLLMSLPMSHATLMPTAVSRAPDARRSAMYARGPTAARCQQQLPFLPRGYPPRSALHAPHLGWIVGMARLQSQHVPPPHHGSCTHHGVWKVGSDVGTDGELCAAPTALCSRLQLSTSARYGLLCDCSEGAGRCATHSIVTRNDLECCPSPGCLQEAHLVPRAPAARARHVCRSAPPAEWHHSRSCRCPHVTSFKSKLHALQLCVRRRKRCSHNLSSTNACCTTKRLVTFVQRHRISEMGG